MKILHAIKFWAAWTLAVGLWVAEPFLSMRYFEVTQRLGYYPTNADSIGIPIFWSFLVAFAGAPFWFLFCRLAFRHLSGPFRTPPHLPPPVPPKALGMVFNRFNPSKWGLLRACLATVVALVFGYITYTLVESARGSDHLYNKLQNSDFSNLSELAVYLKISSYGWAVIWSILGICFIARIMAGKDCNVEARTKVTPILILAWGVTFAVAVAEASILWDKTEVRDRHELEAIKKEKELYGTWQSNAAKAASNNTAVGSFRDLKIIIYPGGSFTAKGVPPGIFFNNSDHNADCSGFWTLRYKDSYHLDFNINRSADCAHGSYGGLLELVNGHFVFNLGFEESINLVRTSTSTGEP